MEKKSKDYVNTFKYLYSYHYLFVEIHYKLFYLTNIKGLFNGW